MTDVQVTLSLPVLKVGSSPESGPTVIKHLQLMLNQRGGFPVLIEDGEFGSSTGASVEHYQQNENFYCRRGRRKTDLDFAPYKPLPHRMRDLTRSSRLFYS
jgi:hypothetical protein